MRKLTGAALAFFSLTACTVTPVARHDYSKMQQDVFTDVVKGIRGNTRHLSSNLSKGRELSEEIVRGKRRDELEALFRTPGGKCRMLDTVNVMNCSVERWWTYTDVRLVAERENICKPGMGIFYSFYFDDVRQPSARLSKFNMDVLHYSHCPDEATRTGAGGPHGTTSLVMP